MTTRRLSRRQRGMSLIEVLTALLIFSFGVLGMVGMQMRALKVSVESEDRSRAALMANEIVSQMIVGRTVSPPAGQIGAWVTRLQDPSVSGLPNATGAITTATVDGVLVATVTITWRSPSRPASDPASTYFTQVSVP